MRLVGSCCRIHKSWKLEASSLLGGVAGELQLASAAGSGPVHGPWLGQLARDTRVEGKIPVE
uniref:Uncharacterized protein n=1 Tax=Arundo donax TaxID=35708 RepID=A0A0A9BIN6_ARUDO